MKPRYKAYLRLNIMSLLFLAVSFISVTLAWFAYSGLVKVETEVNIKAWNIELEKDGQSVSNNIVISLSEVYPGMDTVNEIVNINNLGDSDASVNYSIVSARILDEDNYEIDGITTTSEYVEDALSHNYPFHVNINLSKNYVLSHGEESIFEVSISWPLDSDTDAIDSEWGKDAYNFQFNEEEQRNLDSNYQIRPSIQIVISVTAEQYLEEDTSSDTDYNLGDTILYDPINNQICNEIGLTCLETRVIDINNKLGDDTVTLLPNPNNTYLNGIYSNYNTMLSSITSSWTVPTRPLVVKDILNVISKDIMEANLVRDNLSNAIIGKLTYGSRLSTELAKAVNYNGYYNFLNSKFTYLTTDTCYWINDEYNINNAFAIKKIDTDNSMVYGETKTTTCNVVPVIIANKENLYN